MLEKNQYLHKAYLFSGINDADQFMIGLGIVVLVFYIFTNVYIIVVNNSIMRFSLNQGYKISTKLFTAYLSRDYIFFTNHNTAELSRVIFQDVARLTDNVLTPFLMLVSRSASVIAILVLLVVVDPIVTGVAAFLFGGCYILFFMLNRKALIDIGQRFSYYNNLRFRLVSEAFGGIKDCKIYGAEHYFVEKYRDSSYLDAINQAKRRMLLFIPRYVIETLAIGSLIIFSIFTYIQGKSDGLIATLLVFSLAAYKIMPAIQIIYTNVGQIKSDKRALDLVLQDIALAEQGVVTQRFEVGDFTFKDILKIKNLSFSYPTASQPVFKNLNLEIEPNTIVGFAGRSGSGKSTLVDIILGLLDYQQGEIIIDNRQLTARNKSGWQNKLGYVPQSIHLLDASLAENIAFGISKEQIDYQRVRKALVAAQLEELVDHELADGVETFVGERGARLSGGQRQRIGIARALYRQPEVLILDEATSALDNLTEGLIVDSICKLSGELTIIMIAHRLTTLRQCDKIYVLEKGRITATGKYDELMANNEYFQS
ncbi:ABC transporter ATP-binding protein [Methylotuvimicrobium sp.]